MPEPFLAIEDVAKSYGGARALRGVSLGMRVAEVHGLVGANGAGKSTLIRVLAGLVQPDGGRIVLDGSPVTIASARRAAALGMSFIHQELAFVPGMTVLQNILLGLPKRSRLGMIDWRAAARAVEPVARRVGLSAPLLGPIRGLSVAEHGLVSICRALVTRARLIVMDEPTASLSAREADRLFDIVAGLAASGTAVLYVSHRLDDILRLCDRVTAFRDGRSVVHLEGAALTRAALVDAIVGRGVEPAGRAIAAPTRGEVALEVRGMTRLPRVRDVSLTLRRGEVLGLGGLVGAGRTELARLIYGADRPDAGTMTLRGRPFAPRAPSAAVRAGVGLVPEERRAEGLVLTKSVGFNLQIASRDRASRSALAGIVRDLAIRTESIQTRVGRLSGGNQQKVVIGRWLLRAPDVLILDEPTRGVDIGARADIHRLVRALAARGMAVLVISSEPDELPDLCDRVLVMSEGRVVGHLEGAAISRGAIIEASYTAAAVFH